MRNLVVIAADEQRLAGLPDDVAHCAWDVDSGGSYLCTPTGAITFVSPNAQQYQGGWVLDLAEAQPLDDPTGTCDITGFAHVPEAGALCVSDASGRLLMIDTETRAIEEVGYLDGGVAALQWAPDGETLCIITCRGQMLLMTKEWDVLDEVSLLEDSAGPEDAAATLSHEHVAICWRGDCKYFATLLQQQSQQQPQQTGGQVQQQAGPAATCMAIMSLKIWLRSGCKLHAIGEGADGLLPVGAWQPNGRHLYVAQQKPSGPRVLLFETNGLQHGGFDVGPSGSVAAMDWSVDSEMLALVVAQSPAAGSGGPKADRSPSQRWVQVWRRSNWQWYLKHEARHDAVEGHLLIAWDDAASSRLHTCAAAGRLSASNFLQQYAVSRRGTAAVVDGARLLLTPLQHELVPPPMASVVAACPAPVQSVSFRTTADQRESLAALLSDGSVAVFAAAEQDFWGEGDDAAVAVEADDGADSEALLQPQRCVSVGAGGWRARQLVWLDDEHVLLVAQCLSPQMDGTAAQPSSSADELLVVDLADGSVQSEVRLPPGQQVLRALSAEGSAPALLQLQDGALAEFRDGALTRLASSSFLAPCPLMARIPAGAAGPDAPLAIGLTAAGKLLWGPHPIATATAVTSFTVRTEGPGGAFLLWTERGGLLHTVPLAGLRDWVPADSLQGAAPRRRPRGGRQDALGQAMHAAMRPALADGAAMAITERAYEQGGLLVAAPPGAARAVLQMPRGNLEAVAPRVLVLAEIADRLQSGDYAAAWEAAITSRVDLNCLVDFAWPAFLSAASAFVMAVGSDSDIADLIAALQPGSVVAADGLYAGMADILPDVAQQPGDEAAAPSAAQTDIAEKVPRVCEALRAAMAAAGQRRFFRATLTSLSKVGRLADALRLVKDAKEAELAREGDTNGHASSAGNLEESLPSAEDGLKHLMLYTDVETLYRAALGEYELGLAYMVITASQRDPGEYMLQLQRFASAGPPEMQKHAVDMHLGRHSRALRHLMSSQPPRFDAALALARDKGLLRELAAHCADAPQRRAAALAALGEALSARSMHEDAGVAFAAAGQLDAALDSYRSAGAWQMAMAIAGRLGWAADRQLALATDMAEELGATGTPADAAALYADYAGDAEAAVAHLLQAHAWRDALRTAYRFLRGDLVDAAVVPATVGAAEALAEGTAADIERTAKYLERYRDVRAKRAAMQEHLADGAAAAAAGRDADSGSDVESSTAVSDLSAYAAGSTIAASESNSGVPASTVGGRRPARNARQKARKGARIRKGGPGEELALAEHLASLAPTPQRLAEAGALAEALVILGREDLAASLQQAQSQLQTDQQAAAEHVAQHPPALQEEAEQQAAKEGAKVPATEDVRWKWDMLRPVVLEDLDSSST